MHTKKRLKKKRLILWCGNNEAIYPLSLSVGEEEKQTWRTSVQMKFTVQPILWLLVFYQSAHGSRRHIANQSLWSNYKKREPFSKVLRCSNVCARAQPFDAVIIAFLCYLFTVALFEHEAIHFQLDRNIEYFSNIDWLINEPMRFPSFHHEKRGRARSQLDAKTKTVWKYSGLSFMGANDNL